MLNNKNNSDKFWEELYGKPYKQIAYNTPKPKQEWVQLELNLADTINYHGDIEVLYDTAPDILSPPTEDDYA